MNHRLIAFGIGLLVILAIVGGAVYWQWPEVPVGDNPPGLRATSTPDLITEEVTSAVNALGQPTVGPPPAEATPRITWTPSSVFEVIGQGQTKIVQVSFTASEEASDVVIQVVSELQPFVQVNPSVLGKVVRGQSAALDVIVSVSGNAPLGVFQGTIQLRSGSVPKKTFSRSLPVTVEVWQRFSSATLGFSIAYPPDWIASSDDRKVVFSSTGMAPPSEDDFGAEVELLVEVNPEAMPLNQWLLENYGVDVSSLPQGDLSTGVLRDGTSYIQVLGAIPSAHPDTAHVLIGRSAQVFVLRVHPAMVFKKEFRLILNSLEFF